MLNLHPDDVPWHGPPGHARGNSRLRMEPDRSGSHNLDRRLSRCSPVGAVALHAHEVDEHVHHMIEGTGDAPCGAEREQVESGTATFVPSGVPRSPTSSGDGDLVFVVVAFPTSDSRR